MEFEAGSTEPPATLEYEMKLGDEERGARSSKRGTGQRFELLTCRVEYEEEETEEPGGKKQRVRR